MMKTYFIEAQATGLIKIGRSVEPSRRLKDLMTASPAALRLIGVLEQDCERELHQQYASLRTTGEWFKAEDPLLTYLKYQFGFRGRIAKPSRRTLAGRREDHLADCVAMLEDWYGAPVLMRPDIEVDDYDWMKFEDVVVDRFLERSPEDVVQRGISDEELLDQLQEDHDTVWGALRELMEEQFPHWLGWIEARAHREHGDLVLVFRTPKGIARERLCDAILLAGCTVEGYNECECFTSKTASAILLNTEEGAITELFHFECYGVHCPCMRDVLDQEAKLRAYMNGAVNA